MDSAKNRVIAAIPFLFTVFLITASGCTSTSTTTSTTTTRMTRTTSGLNNQPVLLSSAVPYLSEAEITSSIAYPRGAKPLTFENYAANDNAPNLLGNRYIVAKGDTLYGISKTTGVSIDNIARHNKLANKSRIKPGMILKIPTA